MTYRDIRLIALDLDGTLLNDAKGIPDRTVGTIRQVMEQGVIVTLASARPFCSMLPYARQLGITAPLISNGGAYVADAGQEKVLAERPLGLAQYREMVSLLEERDYYIKVYRNDRLYVQEAIDETMAYSSAFAVPYTEVGRRRLATLAEAPFRVFVYANLAEALVARQLLAPWSEEVALTGEADSGLEVLNRSVNKGEALRAICQEFGVPMTKVIAIGNEENDVEMIKAAGLGIAMGNACAALRQHADWVTKTNNEGGVGEALQKYVLRRSD